MNEAGTGAGDPIAQGVLSLNEAGADAPGVLKPGREEKAENIE